MQGDELKNTVKERYGRAALNVVAGKSGGEGGEGSASEPG